METLQKVNGARNCNNHKNITDGFKLKENALQTLSCGMWDSITVIYGLGWAGRQKTSQSMFNKIYKTDNDLKT